MRSKFLLVLSMMILLCGCSADWHLRKAISKKPSILTEGIIVTEERDTIAVTTEKLVHDTIFDFTTDKVVIEKGKGRATIDVDTVRKTIYVEIECDADTIYVEKIVRKTTIQPQVKDKGFDWVCIAFVAFGILFVALMSKV